MELDLNQDGIKCRMVANISGLNSVERLFQHLDGYDIIQIHKTPVTCVKGMFPHRVFKAQKQGPSFRVKTECIGLDDTAVLSAVEFQLAPLRDRLLDDARHERLFLRCLISRSSAFDTPGMEIIGRSGPLAATVLRLPLGKIIDTANLPRPVSMPPRQLAL
jgi:hypothetical protein